MRQRIDDQRKMNMLKKINFYEYLISYGGPSNSFMAGEPLHNYVKHNTTFLPKIKKNNPQEVETDIDKQEIITKKCETESMRENSPSISTSKEPIVHKTMIAESFRPSKKEEVINLKELVAKSLTPSTRISKESNSRKNKQRFRSIDVTSKFSFHNSGKDSLNQRKTTIGRTLFTKIHRPPQLDIPGTRKPSISGWEIDISPLPLSP